MRTAATPSISHAQRSVDAETMRAVVRLRYGGSRGVGIEQILRTPDRGDEVLLPGQAAGLEKRAEEFTEQGLDGLAGADIEEAKKIRAALAADQETAVESKPRRTAARSK